MQAVVSVSFPRATALRTQSSYPEVERTHRIADQRLSTTYPDTLGRFQAPVQYNH